MVEYSGKTLEDALNKASEDLEIEIENLVYSIEQEKKGLFSKKTTIAVYMMEDIVHYAEEYLLSITDTLNIEATVETELVDGIMKMTIDSTNNPILIGKNGKTLQALSDLTKAAVSYKFHRHFRILLDVNGYKDKKYRKLAFKAKTVAKEVQRTKITATLDPMPADERRVVHNALTRMHNIKTESKGVGSNRQVQIIYIENNSVKSIKEEDTEE